MYAFLTASHGTLVVDERRLCRPDGAGEPILAVLSPAQLGTSACFVTESGVLATSDVLAVADGWQLAAAARGRTMPDHVHLIARSLNA